MLLSYAWNRSMRYLIVLLILSLFPSESASAQSVVHFTIDARKEVRPISRLIYGVNQPIDSAWANAAFLRFGGNRTTAYNWVTNASNAGNDLPQQGYAEPVLQSDSSG